ncbi:MAG: hypothetical protein M9960_08105 [Xanthomonadaceae bacterium]|nr:hypothetical protein [Xanthomonadaceae bacterium]
MSKTYCFYIAIDHIAENSDKGNLEKPSLSRAQAAYFPRLDLTPGHSHEAQRHQDRPVRR